MTPSLPSLPTNLAVAIEVYVTNADGSNQKSVTKTAMRVAYFDLIWAGGSGGPALLLEDDCALAVYEYPVSRCQRTARARTRRSTSRPRLTRSSTVSRWVTWAIS